MISYQDKKRYMWLISILFPFVLPMIGIGLYLYLQEEWTLAIPLVIAYGLIPLFWII